MVTPMAVRRLTDFAIRNMKAGQTRREFPDSGCPGLYVVVQPSGAKSFAVRYRYGGRTRKLTLPGSLSLKAARKAASDAILDVSQGRDPSAAKQAAKQAQKVAAENTFEAVAEMYLKIEGGRMRSGKWRTDILRRHVYPTLGKRPIAGIKRSEIIGLLDKIEAGELSVSKTGGTVMADRTLAVIRRVFSWYAPRTDDFRSPIVRGMMRAKPAEHARSRVLGDEEIRAIWTATDVTGGAFSAFIRFLLLTGARRNEVARLTWSEIQGSDWSLPASRNKAKVDLLRPLSRAAMNIIETQPHLVDSPWVFTSNGKTAISGFSMRKADFDQRCGVTDWTLHDLRRTARSLMSRAGVNSDHAERCLGHVIGGVRGTYDRHEYLEEKRHAFEALAGQIERIVNPVENVVPMRG
jgi:integrase